VRGPLGRYASGVDGHRNLPTLGRVTGSAVSFIRAPGLSDGYRRRIATARHERASVRDRSRFRRTDAREDNGV